MNQAKLQRLLREYFNNTINSTDRRDLLEYLNKTGIAETEEAITEELLDLHIGTGFPDKEKVYQKIINDPRYLSNPAQPLYKTLPLYKKAWFKIAAAILAFVGISLILFTYPTPEKKLAVSQKYFNTIAPGGNKAILTTGNGKQIMLQEAAYGVLLESGTSKVVKLKSGEIAYQKNSKISAAVEYNTLTTPKGGEYQVTLPDGTKVWLNAASKITYATQFNQDNRQVKLEGEAYFEVAKDPKHPFYVITPNTTIRVLGTHFNVSAYGDDEITATTLLEGSVKVSNKDINAMLKPGQQARITNHANAFEVSNVDENEVMAWKNGYFIFDDDNIAGIMKKVARWYDVDVDYKGSFNDIQFGGTYHRSKGIEELLHHLEKIGNIHFNITGRRITVMK